MANGRQSSDTLTRDEAARQDENLMLQQRMGDIGQKLLVLSGKGGVGKSTIAANLAMSLANRGKRVGLIDVDIHGPSIPKLLRLEGKRPEMGESQLQPLQVTENLKVMSIAFFMESNNDAVIWRGPRKYGVIRQFLKDVDWGQLDYLVVDSPPGTGDEPLAVAQLVGSPAAALVVTTPQDLSISDVRRCVSFCNTLSLRVMGIVENMSGFVCPHCGEATDLFGSGGGQTLAKEMNVPFLGRIPIDPQVVISGDSGTPFVQHSPQGPAAKAFADVIAPLLDAEQSSDQPTPANTTKESENMKIAVPLSNGLLSMHFGHCEQFAIVTVDETTKTIAATDLLTPPAHEPGVLPQWLHEQGANVIIAGGMGQRAQQLFAQNDINVVVGAQGGTAEELVSAYLQGSLEAGDNLCDH